MQITSRPSGIPQAASSIGAARNPAPKSTFSTNDNSAWLGITERLDRFDKAALELRGLLDEPKTKLGGKLASVSSADDLGLSNFETQSILRSAQEVNSIPTSFTPFEPIWVGSTTAQPIMDGAYTGVQDEVFTFEVTKADKKGKVPTRIEVRDSAGALVDNISISHLTPPGTEFTLNSGLVVSFGPGDFDKNDTFEVEAFTTVPSTVDPDKPMNGVGNDNALLEYPLEVVDGSFTINGVEIAVSASDTINEVLARMADSEAGVFATFDDVTESVVLQQWLRGPEPITLADDTSGFLAAMKLDTAVVEPGEPPQVAQPMADVSKFAGVTAGSVVVNGVSVAIDPSSDSLLDVLARIEDEADVNTIMVDGDMVTFRGWRKGEPISLNSNGTGFFEALDMPTGTTEAPAGATKMVDSTTSRRIAEAVKDYANALNGILDLDRQGATADGVINKFGDDLRGAVGDIFDTSVGSDFRSSIGITFDLGKGSREFIDFGGSAKSKFSRTLARRYEDLYEAFVDPGRGKKGLLDKIDAIAKGLRRSAAGRVDITL